MAKVLPDLFSMMSLQEVIASEWKDPVKATSALRAYERTETVTVEPSQGNAETPYSFEFPKWHEMREGIAIPAIPMGQAVFDAETGKTGGYRPARNPTFKKYATRSMRPVVDFEKCIKCTLCWLQCPDSCFDVMPDGMYDANMEACCGCGVCEAVCPVASCITMVSETQFRDNASQWDMWKKDKDGYARWVTEHIGSHPERSHGFRYRGQYEAQVPEMLSIAGETPAPAAVPGEAPAEAPAAHY
jgi:pyruvate ferredoxin oxidoreductase delta subunit